MSAAAREIEVKRPRIEPMLAEVVAADAQWWKVATDVGIARAAQDRMARAFRLASP